MATIVCSDDSELEVDRGDHEALEEKMSIFTRGAKDRSLPFPVQKMNRYRVFNRWNTLGMNATVCLCLCVRRVVKEGGNGIRGNTFGRGGRAT